MYAGVLDDVLFTIGVFSLYLPNRAAYKCDLVKHFLGVSSFPIFKLGSTNIIHKGDFHEVNSDPCGFVL